MEQLTKDEQCQLPRYPRSIPDPNPSDIPSPTLVLLLRHHPLRDFVSAMYATVGIGHLSHLCLKRRALVSQIIAFRVTIAM